MRDSRFFSQLQGQGALPTQTGARCLRHPIYTPNLVSSFLSSCKADGSTFTLYTRIPKEINLAQIGQHDRASPSSSPYGRSGTGPKRE